MNTVFTVENDHNSNSSLILAIKYQSVVNINKLLLLDLGLAQGRRLAPDSDIGQGNGPASARRLLVEVCFYLCCLLR